MSSDDIIKTVSKKLKYYFDVKRLEDGFDLSGPDCPKLDHPPLKARPTLMYDGLHDKPVKHYFSPHDVKVALTKFNMSKDKKGREKQIRRSLESYMQRWNYYEALAQPPVREDSRARPHPWLDSRSYPRGHQPSRSISSSYHLRSARSPRSRTTSARSRQGHSLSESSYTSHGDRKLKRDTTGFGRPLAKNKSPHSGGYPILRSKPPRSISHGEAHRLINIASRLLVASETVDLSTGKVQSGSNSNEHEQGLPRLDDNGSRPKSSKGRRHQYDIHGRKVMVKKNRNKDTESDSAYHSPPEEGDEDVPRWLRKEMSKVDLPEEESPTRPKSAFSPHPPADSPDSGRPQSAGSRPKSSSRQVSRQSSKQQTSRQNSSSSSHSDEETSTRPSSREDAAAQTSRALISAYDPMESVLWDGEKVTYKVHVWTGNRLGASTKADIKLVLTGNKGRTQEIFLRDSKTYKVKFQRGQEDVFILDTFYVGPLKQISIGHDRSELGFGWYLEKVAVQDMTHKLLYQVPCDCWMSSREGDGVTFRQLSVASSQTYDEEPEDSEHQSPGQDVQDTVRYEKAESVVSHTSRTESQASHTSLDTNYSERRGEQATARSDTSTGTSVTDSSSRSSSSSSSTSSGSTVKHKPTPPQHPRRSLQRNDTFFDLDTPKKDYSSVIDSLSTTADDHRDRARDFDRDDEETGRLTRADVSDDDNDKAHDTVRLSYQEPTEKQERDSDREKQEQYKKEEKDKYLDGFKAGLEAASQSRVDYEEKKVEEQSVMQGMTIHQAAKTGNLDRIKALLDHNPQLKMSQDERGWNPLHVAASHGMTDIVKWLAVEGVSLDTNTPTGYSPMHLAAMNGFTNTMMVLHALGAQIGTKSVEYQTPLHVAAMCGHLETCKWLVANRAALDTVDHLGRKPLDIAEENQHTEVADFLRSCSYDMQKPNSSFSLIRSNSKTSLDVNPEDSASNAGDKPVAAEEGTWQDDNEKQVKMRNMKKSKEKSESGSSASSSSGSESEDDAPAASHDTDDDLLAKKKLYEEQKKKQEKRRISFLDSIRDEVDSK